MWPCFFPGSKAPSLSSLSSFCSIRGKKKPGPTLQASVAKAMKPSICIPSHLFPSLNVWRRSPWSQTLFKCTTKELDTHIHSQPSFCPCPSLTLPLSVSHISSPLLLSLTPSVMGFFFHFNLLLAHPSASRAKLTVSYRKKVLHRAQTITMTDYWHLSDQLTGGISSFIIEVIHSWNST